MCRSTASFLAAFVLIAPESFAKEYRATRYDVSVRLERGGVAQVSETAVFHFQGGPFTYVFRDISASKTDGIDSVRAYLDDRRCTEGSGPGQVEIGGHNPVRVRWHFAPVADESHTFRVEYRAQGVIRKAEHADALIWRALPEQRRYRIRYAEIRLEYPANVHPLAAPVLRGGERFEARGAGAVIAVEDVGPKSDVVLSAQFPPGSLAETPPRWETLARESQSRFTTGLRDGALLAFGLIAVGALWFFRVRESFPTTNVISGDVEQAQPPGDLAPAYAAELTRRYGGPIATVLDLARRGVVTIEETKHHGWAPRAFLLRRAAAHSSIAPHEKVLLSVLFERGESQIKMIDATRRLQRKRPQFTAAIKEGLRSAGLLDPVRDQKRRTALIIFGILMAAGGLTAGFGAVLATRAEHWPAGLTIALGAGAFLLGLCGLIFASLLQPWTDQGAAVAVRWQAFRRYLSNVARGRMRLPDPAEFEPFLPYAAAFGIAGPWTKRFHREAGLVLPPWFAALPAGDGSEMAAFVACMGTADSSAAGAASAGGTASGGGASGAG